MRHGNLQSKQRGFTVLEIAIVVLAAGVVLAISVPRITAAMREYRLNIATRQVVDGLKRARMLAVSENRRASIALDLEGRRIGVALLDEDGGIERIEFAPLPEGVRFDRPSGTGPEGISGTRVVSFDERDGVHRLDFSSRGFPLVDFGDIVSVFLGNSESFRAITMTSVGGVRTYRFENDRWFNTGDSSGRSEADSDPGD